MPEVRKDQLRAEGEARPHRSVHDKLRLSGGDMNIPD